jgi:hypothetical protein
MERKWTGSYSSGRCMCSVFGWDGRQQAAGLGLLMLPFNKRDRRIDSWGRASSALWHIIAQSRPNFSSRDRLAQMEWVRLET